MRAMMAEGTDGREAADAVRRSEDRLRVARARAPVVARLAARLRPHLEANHFARRIERAYGKEDDE